MDDKFYQEDGPELKYLDGTEFWYLNDGKLHREDGPAVIFNGGCLMNNILLKNFFK